MGTTPVAGWRAFVRGADATNATYAFGAENSAQTALFTVRNDGAVAIPNGQLAISGNTALHAGNYNSYSPTLTGGGASGTWNINITGTAALPDVVTAGTFGGNNAIPRITVDAKGRITGYSTITPSGTYGIRITGFANAGSPYLYSTDAAYNYDSANPYYGYLTFDGSRWLFQVSPATPAAVRVAYADTAGSATNGLTTSNYSSYALPLSGGSLTGHLVLDSDWNVGGTFTEQLSIYGTYPSWTTRSDTSGTGWLFHTDGSGHWTLYSIVGQTTNNWTQRYTFNTDGTFRNGGPSGNIYLHAGNYNSYAPTLTGGGASGTWNINITGTAATATSATNSTSTSQRAFSGDISTTGQGRFTGWYSGNAATGFAGEYGISGGEAYLIAYNRDTSQYGNLNINATNIRIAPQGGSLTGPSNNVILHAGNYTSYAPSLTGSGASGTWGISITGNAATVGGLGTGSFTRKDTTLQWIKPYYEYGNYLTNESPATLASQMSSGGGLRVDFMYPSYTGSGNWNHVITFSGYNFYNMYQLGGNYDGGTGTDLWVRSEANHGGSSWTSWRRLLNSSNYNSYSPTLTGGGASGTWGINISGVAADVNGGRFSTTASSYVNFYTWAHFHSGVGGYGLYWPSSGAGTHLYPFGGAYGSFIVEGNRNGYYGFMYATGVGNAGWMTTGNTAGFYNHTYGWKYYHESGNFYIYTGTYGGGSGYIALHAGNYSSYALPLSGGTITGNLDFSQSSNHYIRFGTSSNWYHYLASEGDNFRIYDAQNTTFVHCVYNGGGSSKYTQIQGTLLVSSSGVVNIGTSSAYKLAVGGDIFATGGWLRTTGGAGWYNDTYGGGIWMSDSTWVRVYGTKDFYATASIAAVGNVTAYYSDERLKTKVGDIDNALAKVRKLSGFLYVENELARKVGYKNTKQQVGVSAQRVREVLPEAVSLAPFDMETDSETGELSSKSGEEYLTVDYSRLVPLLIEAIKDLADMVEELR